MTGCDTCPDRRTLNTAALPSSTGAASATETTTVPSRSRTLVGFDAGAVVETATVPAALVAAVSSTASVSPARTPPVRTLSSSTSSVLVLMVIVPLERPAGIVSLPLGLV